ncbi:MAG: SDR family oxidoreductase [Candidatus Caenarcaniphilales bacterium]|nr:SDR family oxidoreductase [Candidatus Caenarcaniphilales bacterium]
MKDYYQKNKLPEAVQPNCPIVQSLKGQKAIVTGASSGIGKEIAIAIGKAGADVIINYASSIKGAEEAVKEIEKCGGKAFPFKADVSNEEEVVAMFEEAKKQFGSLDILVNNAGLQKDAPFDEMTIEQWDRVINVNLRGQFLCSREAVKEFKNKGINPNISCAAGKIICVSSVHDVIPWAGHVNYAASKGGVSLLMKSVAQEVAPLRIRVNAIAPGAIRTPINHEAWATEEAYSDLMKLIPYKRIGEPEEIGRAAVWLASDDSDYITGTTLYVDGGMTLYPGFETGG